MDKYSDIYIDNVLHNSNYLPAGNYFAVYYLLSPNGFNAWSRDGKYEVLPVSVTHRQFCISGRYFTKESDANDFLKTVRDEHEIVIIQLMLKHVNTAARTIKKRKLDGSGRISTAINDINKILNNLLPC